MKIARLKPNLQKLCLTVFAGILLHFSSVSQSITTNAAQSVFSRTYDTLVAGKGVGDYKISFDQWDSRWGKLVAVRVRATPRVQYSFSLKNVADSAADNYQVVLGREESLSGPALPTPFHKISYDSMGAFPLEPGKLRGLSGAVLDNSHDYMDSITENIQPFVGTGKVDFSYSPTVWSKVSSDRNVSFYYDAAIRDSTMLSLTYFYRADAASKTGSQQYIKETITHRPASDNLTLYPNPAKNFIQLAFNEPAGSDWQVDILAADGRPVQSNRYFKMSQARVDFVGKFMDGTYFARVTNIRTSRKVTTAFVVMK